MKVTIKDLAKACGVSISTVSMALSEKPNRISANTRAQIREMAKKMNYQPNLAAVSLVKRKSRSVGIVVNDLRNTHISSLYMAIDREIEKNGYSPICHVYSDEQANAAEILNQMESENVSAIIWAKSLDIGKKEENQLIQERVQRMGVPIIAMDDYGFSCLGTDVLFDYRKGALLAVRNLIANGHKRIGCLAGERSYAVTQERIAGCREALEEAGISWEESLVYYGDYTQEAGYQALSYLMGQNVTAVFSFNDEMAFGIYRAARNYGIRIPDQLSVIGFDDVPFADVMEVPLSTIRVPINEMGEFIGEEINRWMNAEDNDLGRKKKIYQPALLVRRSVRRRQPEGEKK